MKEREGERQVRMLFDEEFYYEFVHECPEFCAIAIALENGESPYKMIEHLSKSNKSLRESVAKLTILARPEPIIIKPNEK
jgi:hypothetical protein